MEKKISAAVLVGGESRRMGCNKAFLRLEDSTMLESIISRVSLVIPDVFLVGCDEKLYSYLKLPFYTDIYKDCGPLGGIHCALYESKTPYVFICACDMPYLEPQLINYMADKAIKYDYDIVVPYVRDEVEPLFAIYSKNCLATISARIKSGRKKIREVFKRVNTNYICADEIRKITNPDLAFINLNTQNDVRKARQLVSGD